MPGFSPAARVRALTGGTVNRSFSVETDAGRYFLRLHEAAGLALGADHEREAQLQEAAAAAGLAPRLVYADPQHRFAISEFLAGRVWSPGGFRRARRSSTSSARRCAACTRSCRRSPRHSICRPCCRALRTGSAHAAPDEQPCHRQVDGAGAPQSARGAAAKPAAPTLFHSDPHHSNLIELDDGRLLLIDWEYAAVGDPLFDLACVLAYYPVAAPHACRLLQAAGLAEQATPAMLEHDVWLYSLLGLPLVPRPPARGMRHRRRAGCRALHARPAALVQGSCDAGVRVPTPAD